MPMALVHFFVSGHICCLYGMRAPHASVDAGWDSASARQIGLANGIFDRSGQMAACGRAHDAGRYGASVRIEKLAPPTSDPPWEFSQPRCNFDRSRQMAAAEHAHDAGRYDRPFALRNLHRQSAVRPGNFLSASVQTEPHPRSRRARHTGRAHTAPEAPDRTCRLPIPACPPESTYRR
jgi:hypothetical protein